MLLVIIEFDLCCIISCGLLLEFTENNIPLRCGAGRTVGGFASDALCFIMYQSCNTFARYVWSFNCVAIVTSFTTELVAPANMSCPIEL